ncbi:MAG: FG-GAP-like repeat-containing protein [Candidatus Cloacimonetes bacterium]|nr:FG-GAP-like repeat-containing protein [Candidatus Cloacimonadota bacterium]
MIKKNYICVFLVLLLAVTLAAQPWLQNDDMFNSSGVPSLPFSQPRFADIDGDEDMDMILGNLNEAPYYIENVGSVGNPDFSEGNNIFAGISPLDAEMGVCSDLDNDGDLDLITGGFSGLNYFENIGSVNLPEFQLVNNFFSDLAVGQNPVPDLADVDDDDDLDIVVGFSENGSVKIYLNTGSIGNAQYSEDETIEIGDVGLYAYPNFCDLDADNDQDIIVGRDSYGIVYFQNNGTPQNGVWEINETMFSGIGVETYWNSPGICDLNGDGTFDLIFGNAAGPLLYYENNGTPQIPSWQQNTTLFSGVIDVGGASNPVFYDFDEDGDFDLISGTQLGYIKYYQNTGSVYAPAWEEGSDYFASIDHSIYSAITLGDVNNDGNADAIVGDLSGHFYYHRNTGSGFVFESEVLNTVDIGDWSAPRLVDMDNDDDLDIVAGNEAGNLFYFENQGTPEVPDWYEITDFFSGIDVSSNCVPGLGNLNESDGFNVITGDLWGEVQFFENISGVWTEDPTMFTGVSGEQNTTPALVDLDDDGDLDLVLGNYSGTLNYFENLLYNVHSNNETVSPNQFDLSNYPNPFNPSTNIHFSIPSECKVELTIYNILGQKVKTQISETLPAGDYSETWNGMNEFDQPLSSGVYFYKLDINYKTQAIKKCLLLK